VGISGDPIPERRKRMAVVIQWCERCGTLTHFEETPDRWPFGYRCLCWRCLSELYRLQEEWAPPEYRDFGEGD